MGFDYASYNITDGITPEGKFLKSRHHIGSAGIDLGVDFNILSMPDAATISMTFSLYQKMALAPFERGKLFFGFGLGLPF